MPNTHQASRLRVVFTTANPLGSGMVVQAICEENVEPVGFALDTGPTKLSRRSAPQLELPRWKKAILEARLAARFPRAYIPRVLGFAGIHARSFYERLRREEDRLLKFISNECGDHYSELIAATVRRFPTLAEVARSRGQEVMAVENINSEAAAQFIAKCQPDVIVSLGDRIIKPNILSIPRLGVLNGHSSLLPKYRGTSTEFWQIVAGEIETGVTIHWMSARVDEGRIVVQKRWPIHPGASHWQLRALSQFMRVPAWKEAVRLVASGFEGTPQSASEQKTFGQPQLSDLCEFYLVKHGQPNRSR
jgi:folate-dependent phosphoribosylglycinamide formyltransferase PurN